jgi:CheY-like chemotaxis protein
MPVNLTLEVVAERRRAPLAVLIVDDHGAFRASARVLLESEGFCVVGEAASGGEALERARELRPDVVLLDVQLPDIDGFEVAAELAKDEHPPAVILTSTRDVSDYGPRIGTSPARGFVPKAELSGAALTALLDPCG